jgi:hypothetical protein
LEQQQQRAFDLNFYSDEPQNDEIGRRPSITKAIYEYNEHPSQQHLEKGICYCCKKLIPLDPEDSTLLLTIYQLQSSPIAWLQREFDGYSNNNNISNSIVKEKRRQFIEQFSDWLRSHIHKICGNCRQYISHIYMLQSYSLDNNTKEYLNNLRSYMRDLKIEDALKMYLVPNEEAIQSLQRINHPR